MQNGNNAAALAIAEQYVQAFSQLAKTSSTLILPEKTGDISSMVSQVSWDGKGGMNSDPWTVTPEC